MNTKNKIYIFLFLACAVGYGWLWWNVYTAQQYTVTVCLFKRVTHVPCPSCGVTRALQALWQGQFLQALQLNPIGFILFAIMTVLPVWIVYDWCFQKNSLWRFYRYVEQLFRQKLIYLPVIGILLANWAWNIYKGL